MSRGFMLFPLSRAARCSTEVDQQEPGVWYERATARRRAKSEASDCSPCCQWASKLINEACTRHVSPVCVMCRSRRRSLSGDRGWAGNEHKNTSDPCPGSGCRVMRLPLSGDCERRLRTARRKHNAYRRSPSCQRSREDLIQACSLRRRRMETSQLGIGAGMQGRKKHNSNTNSKVISSIVRI